MTVEGRLLIGLKNRLMTPKGRALVYANDSKAFDLFKGVAAKSARTMLDRRLQEPNIRTPLGVVKLQTHLDLAKFVGDTFRDQDAEKPWADVAFSKRGGLGGERAICRSYARLLCRT